MNDYDSYGRLPKASIFKGIQLNTRHSQKSHKFSLSMHIGIHYLIFIQFSPRLGTHVSTDMEWIQYRAVVCMGLVFVFIQHEKLS